MKTKNLGLDLTTDEDTYFDDWRKAMNGDDQSNMQLIDDFAGAVYGVSGEVTLLSENWADMRQSLTINELGENDAIFFTPATAKDKLIAESAGLFVETTDSGVLFTAETVPDEDISLGYFISRGKANE